jgi:hypothetical protein
MNNIIITNDLTLVKCDRETQQLTVSLCAGESLSKIWWTSWWFHPWPPGQSNLHRGQTNLVMCAHRSHFLNLQCILCTRHWILPPSPFPIFSDFTQGHSLLPPLDHNKLRTTLYNIYLSMRYMTRP